MTISLALIGCYEGYDDGGDGGRASDPIVDEAGADIANSAQDCELFEGDIVVDSNAPFDEAPEYSCWDIKGSLTLQGSGVTSLANLKHLRSVAGLLVKDTALTALDPHRTIEVLGVLAVEGNSQLTSLQGLRIESASLEAQSHELRLLDNPLLADLGEVAQVVTLTGALTIDESALPAITFTKLDTVADVTIKDNGALETIAFATLDTAGVVTAKDNPELVTIDFAELDTITDLIVDTNVELTALKVPKVETIGELRIDNADALTSLNDFDDLERITSIYLENNDDLANLGDLMSLDSIVIGARVRDNPRLSQCLVDQLDDCAYPFGTFDSSGNQAPGGMCPTWTCNN